MKTIYIISVLALLAVQSTQGHLDELLIGLGNNARGVQPFGFGFSLGFNKNRDNDYPNNSYADVYRLQQENEYLRRQYEAMVQRYRKPGPEEIHVNNNNYMMMKPYVNDPDRTAAGIDLSNL
ncbi:PREDICTED: uncharacterized protein LOC106109527 [Papilio polytes]|uniref:uncharacterized protein LOC106109527 n=1 Tax=Papilio polytes TaxID=76194 RepID=UPI0006769E96|nr:PREDICTED: uncharacterized protein LOC106109527 [Papilio polytes]